MGDSDPEEALQHLREARAELYEARKALYDGDLEKVDGRLDAVSGPQPHQDVMGGMYVLQEQTSEVIKALRRRSADRPDEYPHGSLGELLELAEGESGDE